jgi:hypothetical protein
MDTAALPGREPVGERGLQGLGGEAGLHLGGPLDPACQGGHATQVPYVPQQPGYNKRLRAARDLVQHCIRALASSTALWFGDVQHNDATSQPVICLLVAYDH